LGGGMVEHGPDAEFVKHPGHKTQMIQDLRAVGLRFRLDVWAV
jgi:hypothetical protein